MRSIFYTEICAVLLAGAMATAEAAELSSENRVAVLSESGYLVSSEVVNLDVVNSIVSGSTLELELPKVSYDCSQSLSISDTDY